MVILFLENSFFFFPIRFCTLHRAVLCIFVYIKPRFFVLLKSLSLYHSEIALSNHPIDISIILFWAGPSSSITSIDLWGKLEYGFHIINIFIVRELNHSKYFHDHQLHSFFMTTFFYSCKRLMIWLLTCFIVPTLYHTKFLNIIK